MCNAGQGLFDRLLLTFEFGKTTLKGHHRLFGKRNQCGNFFGIISTLGNLRNTMMQGVHQRRSAFRVGDEIFLNKRVAIDDPHIAQHLKQHASRLAGPPLMAQPFDQFPPRFAQITPGNVRIGKRGVVVGYFPLRPTWKRHRPWIKRCHVRGLASAKCIV